MKNILALTDFSASAMRATECALTVAAKLGADVLLVNVYPITPYLPSTGLTTLSQNDPGKKRHESIARLNREVRRLEKRLQNSAILRHRPVIRPIPLEGQLADCVAHLARRKNSTLVVMGMSENSYGDFLFSGDVKAVVQLAGRPVLTVPATWTGPEIRHILFATDLAEEDEQVLGRLTALATLLKVKVSVSHVSRPTLIPDFAEETRVSSFVKKIEDRYPGIRCYPARGANILTALEVVGEEQYADVIALRYQKHPVFYRLFHENALKEAITECKMPLLIFRGNFDHND